MVIQPKFSLNSQKNIIISSIFIAIVRISYFACNLKFEARNSFFHIGKIIQGCSIVNLKYKILSAEKRRTKLSVSTFSACVQLQKCFSIWEKEGRGKGFRGGGGYKMYAVRSLKQQSLTRQQQKTFNFCECYCDFQNVL